MLPPAVKRPETGSDKNRHQEIISNRQIFWPFTEGQKASLKEQRMKPLMKPWHEASVIHEDRVLVGLKDGAEPMPGWYGISGGYLREMYRKCGVDPPEK
jgi:hypothetical protein